MKEQRRKSASIGFVKLSAWSRTRKWCDTLSTATRRFFEAVVFTKGLSAALAWRGYKAVGGEFMLLLLPIIYYEAKRIILDFVADFVELYRRAED